MVRVLRLSDDPEEVLDQLIKLPEQLREATISALSEIGNLAVDVAGWRQSIHKS